MIDNSNYNGDEEGILSLTCPICGNEHHLKINWLDYLDYIDGISNSIPSTFPYFNHIQIKQFLTNICPKCLKIQTPYNSQS